MRTRMRSEWRAVARPFAFAAALGLALLALAAAGTAAPAEYFPLNVGDRWVYRSTNQWGIVRTEEVQVTRSFQGGGREVFEMDNYLYRFDARPVQFFNAEPGIAMEMREAEVGPWYPWWAFTGEVDLAVALSDFDLDCIHGSGGSFAGLGTVAVPAGTFGGAATILYDRHPCEDHGVESEVLAPGVGLIQRHVITFAGVETWSLAYAEVNGRVYDAAGAGKSGMAGLSPAVRSTWGAIKSAFAR